MALDPSPDREPGMDARVVVYEPGYPDEVQTEYALSFEGGWVGLGGYGENAHSYSWAELAARHPDATVVLP